MEGKVNELEKNMIKLTLLLEQSIKTQDNLVSAVEDVKSIKIYVKENKESLEAVVAKYDKLSNRFYDYKDTTSDDLHHIERDGLKLTKMVASAIMTVMLTLAGYSYKANHELSEQIHTLAIHIEKVEGKVSTLQTIGGK